MTKLLIWISLLTLAALACAMTAPAALRAAPVPEVAKVVQLPQQMTVCGSYGLHVRQAAGADKPLAQDAVLADGTVVTLTGEEAAPQVWAWYEIEQPVRGWVNSKYLCEVAR